LCCTKLYSLLGRAKLILQKTAKIHPIQNRGNAAIACNHLLNQKSPVGFDCEGSKLSRWGTLSVFQFSTDSDDVYICDALQPGVVESFKPLLESKNHVKIMHDCREDSSALFNQFKVRLQNVFDTQIESKLPFLPSLEYLLSTVIQKPSKTLPPSLDDPNLWMYRPLKPDLISYAVNDVIFLNDLRDAFISQKSQTHDDPLIDRHRMIQNYLDYSRTNLHVKSKNELERVGKKVTAMLTSRTQEGFLYFKLNCDKTGAVVSPPVVQNFDAVKIGEFVDCYVTNWSDNLVFLDRL
jgi:exonuclease 3'-5' domain-containing protein 1